MSLLMYLIVGLISGWVATEVCSTDHPHHFFSNTIIGTIGSLLGGYIFEIIGFNNFNIWEATGTAMLGSTVFLIAVKFLTSLPKKSSI